MYSKFQEDILESLDETGEYGFICVVPRFLAIEKKIDFVITACTGIDGHVGENDINDDDFTGLQNQIKRLFHGFNLGIYRYKEGKPESKSTKWEDSFDLLSPEETEKILANKKNWIWYPNQPAYFIADKGGDKVEEYVANMYKSKLP